MYLLDTDVMIDVLRQHPPALQWTSSLLDDIVLPGFVMMEMYEGCKDAREMFLLQRRLDSIHVVWLSPAYCAAALKCHRMLRLSCGIGIIDVLIGHTAIEHDMPLYTFNRKHFSQIQGQHTIQPYTR